MPEPERAVSVPKSVKELLHGYLNTCQVMNKLWIYAMAFLCLLYTSDAADDLLQV